MANIQPQSSKAKRRIARKRLKNRSADVRNFASLSTAEKWDLLASILPQLVDLLNEEDA